jgi:hypothetical protein
MRIFINSKADVFPYMIGWYETPDRNALEQYGTVDIFARWDQQTVGSFDPPMPVSYGVDRFLEWNNYLHDGEYIVVGPAQNGVSPDTRVLGISDDSDDSSYYYGIQDSLENVWKLFELQGKVAQPLMETSYTDRVTALMHHVTLQAVDACFNPAVVPDGSYIEVRTSDNVQLIDITDESSPKAVNLNRTVSYLATPDSMGQAVLQINIGNEADLTAGTTLYYRLVAKSSLSHHQSKPYLMMKLKDGDGTIGWNAFNISYAMHQRMNSQQYGTPQLSGGQSPHDLIDANFSNKYRSGQAKIEGQFQQGYDSLSQASAPNNFAPLPAPSVTNGVRGEEIDPLSHVLTIPSASATAYGSWSNKINPIHWAKQLTKLAKKMLDKIIDLIKKMINDVMNALANILENLGLNGLANAVLQLESSIDMVLDMTEMFINVALDILIGLEDFAGAWAIGQGLRNIAEAAVGGTVVNNMLSSGKSLVSQATGFLNSIEDKLDGYIDDVFGTSSVSGSTGLVLAGSSAGTVDWDSITARTTSISKNSTNNQHKRDHVYNQIRNNIDFSSASAVLADTRVPQSIVNLLESVSDDFIDLIESSANDMVALIKDIDSIQVKSAISDLGKLLKTLLKGIFRIIESLLTNMVNAIGDLAESVAGFLHSEVPGWVADIWNYTLKPLFCLSSNLKYWSDLGFFIVGYMTNVSYIFDAALKTDLEQVIAGSDFQNNVIDMMSVNSTARALKLKALSPTELKNMSIASTALSMASSVLSFIGREIPAKSGEAKLTTLACASIFAGFPANLLKILATCPDGCPSGAKPLDVSREIYDIIAVNWAEGMLNLWNSMSAADHNPASKITGAGYVQGILDFGDVALSSAQIVESPIKDPIAIGLDVCTGLNGVGKMVLCYGQNTKNEDVITISNVGLEIVCMLQVSLLLTKFS